VDYSLLIMVAAGMMKMATGDDLPLRRSAEMGSRLVFHGYRGLRWWNFFWSFHEASGVSFVLKKSSKISAHLENFHFCTKNNTTIVLLKTTSVRVSSMQIISKPYKIVVNMA
jgi:hypothetical protein